MMIPCHTRILSSILFSTSISSTRLKSSSRVVSSSDAISYHPPPPSETTNIRTAFILTDTKHPGNVGAAARAMKTMGFDQLYLVRPDDERVLNRKKCIDGASGALDILQNAKTFGSLEEIFNQEDDDSPTRTSAEARSAIGTETRRKFIVCGTGMPFDMSKERPMQRYVEPRKYFDEILKKKKTNPADDGHDHHYQNETLNIAFVFGNERMGMRHADMDLCDVMLGIPTNPSFGSLNLASAVQIIAYDWRQAMGGYQLS